MNGLAQYFRKESSAEEFEKANKDGTYHYNVGFSLIGKFIGHWSTKNIYSLYLCDSYLRVYNDFSESMYPSCVKTWEEKWDILSTFFAYPGEVRRIIYTTNIIEVLNLQFQ